jgi:lipopolysaccharide biosynthesis glycosyltransferase
MTDINKSSDEIKSKDIINSYGSTVNSKSNSTVNKTESKHPPIIIPEISSPPIHDRAYVWLLMKGDAYLPGVYASVYSVLRTDPEADLVVMVTDDVSEPARATLLKVATHLFMIPYLSFESKPLKTARQREIYDKWITSSYSKWNALALPYKKVILIDGDTIHLDNTDVLFDLPAPAMPFNNPFNRPIGTVPSTWKGPKGPDRYMLHGCKVPARDIVNVLHQGGILPTAAPVVLEPSLKDYEEYITLIRKMQPFGFPKCNNGPDEQSICWYYSAHRKLDWHNIHHRYNYIIWKDGFLSKGDVPYILHYFSDVKPWAMKFDAYDDVISWYKMAAEAIEKTKISPGDILLSADNISGAKNKPDKFIKKHINVPSVLDLVGVLTKQ